ncbi:MAG: UDP-galactopyranose mutase, partial [Pyrinomonadaceae bacterium]|nr:UDP-galactopyranose mutase [Pyrinomonadaceae bacterium]
MQTTQTNNLSDLVCLSHLRWNFVWQRPQHLLSRFAKHQRVFFVEEPVGSDESSPRTEITRHESGVMVCVPQIPHEQMSDGEAIQQNLLGELLQTHDIKDYFVWYYTPMALGFSQELKPKAVIFD